MPSKLSLFSFCLLVYLSVVGSIFVFRSSNDLPVVANGQLQAVFLSDGQVYFGSLTNYNEGFYKLTKVYYLKEGNTLADTTASLNLVKLGGEVHGPEDLMYIAKDKVLFIEDLKDTSTIVQAIKKNVI